MKPKSERQALVESILKPLNEQEFSQPMESYGDDIDYVKNLLAKHQNDASFHKYVQSHPEHAQFKDAEHHKAGFDRHSRAATLLQSYLALHKND